ncbi:MAG: KH domain-containing protein [bacterium]|nr:KH domain-containing protein [bacterium]
MDLVKLTEELVLAVVSNKDAVGVREFETEAPETILIQVIVDKADMSKLIGKNGKVIKSIRTLVQASSYLSGNKLVKINVDCI